MSSISIIFPISRKDVKQFFTHLDIQDSPFFKAFYLLENANDIKTRMESARGFFEKFTNKRFTTGSITLSHNFVNLNALRQLSVIPFFDNIFNQITYKHHKQKFGTECLRPLEVGHLHSSKNINDSLNMQMDLSQFVSFIVTDLHSSSNVVCDYLLSSHFVKVQDNTLIIADYFKFPYVNNTLHNFGFHFDHDFSLSYQDHQYFSEVGFYNIK